MPWSNQGISLVVIEAGGGGFVGLFVYSGAPVAGNLIASIAPASVTADPYGNTVDTGIVSYSGTSYARINAAILELFDGTRSATAQIFTTATSLNETVLEIAGTSNVAASHPATLALVAGTGATGSTTPPVIITDVLVHRKISGSAVQAEAWQALSLGTGWAAGTPAPAFRLNALGDIQLAGAVTGTSIANGSTVGTLPAGYFGSNVYSAPIAVTSGAAAPSAGQNFRLQFHTNGTLTLQGIATTGNYNVSLDSITFPLSYG